MSKHIIVIKDGELLPIQEGTPCLRMGSIAKALLARGHRVTWLATTWSHQFKSKIDDEGLKHVGERYDVQLLECGSYNKNISRARISHHAAYGRKVGEWLNEQSERPDLVLSAYPIPSVAASAANYCAKHNVPLIVDVRDLWPDVFIDKLGKLGSLLAWPLIRQQSKDLGTTLNVADDIIAVSQKYLQWSRDHAPLDQRDKKRFHHFPIGAEAIDRKGLKPSPAVKKRLDTLKDKTVYGFLGSFGKSYDLDLIVRAAEEFHAQGNEDIHFAIAGDGEQRAMIEEAEARLPNFSYLGWINADDTKAFLCACDVGVMPLQSVPGTFPNKPFQYMAADLPIISSLDGDFGRFVEEEKTGLNFKQGDGVGFIEAIRILSDAKLQSQMRARVGKVFTQRYEQSVVYGKLANIVEQAMF